MANAKNDLDKYRSLARDYEEVRLKAHDSKPDAPSPGVGMIEEKDYNPASYTAWISDPFDDSNKPKSVYKSNSLYPTLNPRRICVVTYQVGLRGVTTYDTYQSCSNNVDYIPGLRGAIIDDIETCTRYIHHSLSGLLESSNYVPEMIDEDYGHLSLEDVFLGTDLTEDFKTSPLFKEAETNTKDRKVISVDGIKLLRTSPKDYRECYIEKKKRILTPLERVNKLVNLLLFEPSQFEEEFTVVEAEPKEYQMRKYIDTLADKVSKVMEEADEIDNLQELMDEAYKEVSFKESAEDVFKRAEEFNDYFKYRLIKDEKEIISKEEHERITEIVETIKEDGDIKYPMSLSTQRKSRKEFKLKNFSDKERMFSVTYTPDIVVRSAGAKCIEIYKVVKINKPILSFPNMVERMQLDLEMAIAHEVISKSYSHEVEKKWSVNINFIVIDSYNTVGKYPVKKATIAQWTKKLYTELDKIEYHLTNASYVLPWEFIKGNVSI